MSLARLRDVSFTYAYAPRPALRSVDLDLEPGLLHGLVGPNGSGKTTLCSVIRGMIPHFHPGDLAGGVEVLGRPAAHWDPAELARRIGFVFQNPFSQISGIKDTVFEEIALGLENLAVPREQIIERVCEVIELVGIGHLAGKNPSDLSGGQRQLVAFAAIIAMDAEFIVMDEPTSQLDPETSRRVFEIIRALKDRGTSILLVEHDIDLLVEVADRLVLMHRGTVLAHGDVREVIASDAFDIAQIRRPDVTDLALTLAARGRPLPRIPLTRDEAAALIAPLLREDPHADPAE
ncbi:energy-coupling factor ABC transporter ATP-binding protein [Brachybacterium hainanense]|uniref:Energy-coupling factor ABC transporter ATP-binding protein n=1 Tax=Brachybacterium hainanense TaxID=1541174 RepID=A0ABV6RB74_9MICO